MLILKGDPRIKNTGSLLLSVVPLDFFFLRVSKINSILSNTLRAVSAKLA